MKKDDNVKVVVRIRPLNQQESNANSRLCVCSLSDEEIMIESKSTESIATTHSICSASNNESIGSHLNNSKTMIFDYVANMNITQKQFFDNAVKPMTKYCIEGYNCTIFAYGQTGSGKTHTIQGPLDIEDINNELRGIMPRCFDYIFHNLEINCQNSTSENLVKCSYLEIYNEKLKDLLDPSSPYLRLREDLQKGVYVEGASETTVTCSRDIMNIIKKGTSNRHISSTDMNKDSSRSHAVMSLNISTKKLEEDIYKTTSSSFHIIDLAGSERVKRTNAVGMTLKEAGMINTSLSTLGNVINSLVEIGKGKK